METKNGFKALVNKTMKKEDYNELNDFTTLEETDYFKLVGQKYMDTDLNRISYDIRVVPVKKSEFVPDIHIYASSKGEIGKRDPITIGTSSYGSKGPNDIRERAEWLNAAAEFVDLLNKNKDYKEILDKTKTYEM